MGKELIGRKVILTGFRFNPEDKGKEAEIVRYDDRDVNLSYQVELGEGRSRYWVTLEPGERWSAKLVEEKDDDYNGELLRVKSDPSYSVFKNNELAVNLASNNDNNLYVKTESVNSKSITWVQLTDESLDDLITVLEYARMVRKNGKT